MNRFRPKVCFSLSLQVHPFMIWPTMFVKTFSFSLLSLHWGHSCSKVEVLSDLEILLLGLWGNTLEAGRLAWWSQSEFMGGERQAVMVPWVCGGNLLRWQRPGDALFGAEALALVNPCSITDDGSDGSNMGLACWDTELWTMSKDWSALGLVAPGTNWCSPFLGVCATARGNSLSGVVSKRS